MRNFDPRRHTLVEATTCAGQHRHGREPSNWFLLITYTGDPVREFLEELSQESLDVDG